MKRLDPGHRAVVTGGGNGSGTASWSTGHPPTIAAYVDEVSIGECIYMPSRTKPGF